MGTKRCPFCAEEIQEAAIKCKHCGELLGPRPSGEAPLAEERPPLEVRASPRALLAKHFLKGLLLVLLLAGVLYLELGTGVRQRWPWLCTGLWLVVLLFTLLVGVRLWIDYLRIKHTRYLVRGRMLEGSSYLFRFLGVANNTVNLQHVRQIKVLANGYLDLWFFHCGSILITVSGDAADFRMENVYRPSLVKAQIEEICSGSPARGADPSVMEAV